MATRSRTRNSKETEGETLIEEKISKPNGEILTNRYKKGRFLGKGGFARVYEFTSLESGKVYAAKVVSKSSLSKSRAKQKLMSEIKIHRSLKHPHIVHFEYFFEDAQNVYILMELCQNQTMSELLRRRKRLTELEVQCYMLQLIFALQHTHSRRVVHRDLKIGNIFINDKMQVKLGDFGLACKLEYEGQKRRTICGTPNYIAPEVLDGKCGHGYEVDCWSLGVVIYTLLVGKPPFETNDVKKTYNLIRMNAYAFPEHIGLSTQSKSLITRILRNDPSKRPSLQEILDHEFFHMGGSIPKLLPVSTLAVPPSDNYIKQFLPNNQNVPHKPTTDTAPVISSVRREKPQMCTQKIAVHSPVKNEKAVWVKKWVDYSAKYGLGYVLSNGHAGVYFNDSTKIIVEPNACRFFYFEKEGKDTQKIYDLEDYPKALYKKVTLLQHFRSYLENENDTLATDDNGPEFTPVFVKKWMRTKRAIVFRLSNKVVQVSFQDHTEVVLSSESKVVTYVSKKGERTCLPLSEALESSNAEMTKRLRYTKDILNYMMNGQGTGGTGSP